MSVNSFDNYYLSWKPTINKTKNSLYRELAIQLKDDVKKGILSPGTKLPPQRELADFLNINVSTVSKAIKLCEFEGIVSSSVGNGTYISYDAISNMRLLMDNISDSIIDLGATEPDDSANAIISETATKILSRPGAENLFNYRNEKAKNYCKVAAVKLFDKCGLNTRPNNILIANGGQNAIIAVLSVVFNYGDSIAVADHTYPGIKSAATLLGLKLVPINQVNGIIDLNNLEFNCKNYNIKGIFVVPAHQNPTTTNLSAEIRKRIAEIALKYNVFIIEDIAYQLLSIPIQPVSAYAPENSFCIASLSKILSPGMRISFISVPNVFKNKLSDALYSLNISISPMMQQLSADIIMTNSFEHIIKMHREKTTQRNKIVNELLKGYEVKGENTCIFRWLYLPETIDITAQKFEALLLKKGVQVYSAERFSIGKTIPQRAIRFTVTSVPLNELIIALKIIKDNLDSN